MDDLIPYERTTQDSALIHRGLPPIPGTRYDPLFGLRRVAYRTKTPEELADEFYEAYGMPKDITLKSLRATEEKKEKEKRINLKMLKDNLKYLISLFQQQLPSLPIID